LKYKVTEVVTNGDVAGDEVIRWYRQPWSKPEEAHSIMEEDLTGRKLPSGLFGANAALWQIINLAFNLNVAMNTCRHKIRPWILGYHVFDNEVRKMLSLRNMVP
jgi:hypothetical protein